MTVTVLRTALLATFAAGALAFAPVKTADAAVTQVTDPGATTVEIGTRLRWGATGFEASIFDANPFGQSPTLNPSGSPVWQLNQAYGFEVTFDRSTGELALSIDFSLDGSFGAGESIARSVFGGATASYAGLGGIFSYISISGNESGSTGRSTMSNLVINGTSVSSIAPGGGFTEPFYRNDDSSLLEDITITGDLTFLTSGTSQERPSWNINLRTGGPTPVPEPAPLALLGAGLLGLGAARLRRRRD